MLQRHTDRDREQRVEPELEAALAAIHVQKPLEQPVRRECAALSAQERAQERRAVENEISDESIFDLFRNQSQPDRQVAVNRYLWQASLDVLSFLPIEGATHNGGLDERFYPELRRFLDGPK